ncbi:MAG: hypothetical protein ICV51_18655 [Flavisolibacter sp.]|nr:hypothetical protein [Flavisolibacter sp.]
MVRSVGQRGIVVTCSYETHKYGIQSAIPSLKAKQLCLQSIFLKGSYHEYSRTPAW